MLRPIADITRQREQIAARCAEVRSVRNRAAREREADREARALNSITRLKRRRADRELEQRLCIRVRLQDHERPRISRHTAHNLFHRAAEHLASFEHFGPARSPAKIQSLYVQWKSRGLTGGSGRAWRPGEAGRFARYIMREDALEGGDWGWSSNVGADRSEVTAFWRTLEQIERHNRANAGVYISIIVPLPHELDADQRSELVGKITAPLASKGIPYVAARHLPDKGGDPRNYHLHLQLSTRFAARLTEYEWDFSAATWAGLNSAAGIRLMRRHFVTQINDALARAGFRRRFTHLTRAERGEPPGEMKRGRGRKTQQQALEREKAVLTRLATGAKTILRYDDARAGFHQRVLSWRHYFQSIKAQHEHRSRRLASLRSRLAYLTSVHEQVRSRALRQRAVQQLALGHRAIEDSRSAIANARDYLALRSRARNLASAIGLHRRQVHAIKQRMREHRLQMIRQRLTLASGQLRSIVAQAHQTLATARSSLAGRRAVAGKARLVAQYYRGMRAIGVAQSQAELSGRALEKWHAYAGVRSTWNRGMETLAIHREQVLHSRKAVAEYRGHLRNKAREELNRQHRTDPQRRAAIENAVGGLAHCRFLPLVRSGDGFAIDPAHLEEPAYRRADMFEAEEMIQRTYHEKWQALISELKALRGSETASPVLERDGRLAPANLAREAKDAFELVGSDVEVQAALRHAHDRWVIFQAQIVQENERREAQRIRKLQQLREALQAVVAAYRDLAEQRPRIAKELDILKPEANAVVRALARQELAIIIRDGRLVFFAADQELRPATDLLAQSRLGRAMLAKLGHAIAPFNEVSHRWTTWQETAPEPPPPGEVDVVVAAWRGKGGTGRG